MRVKYKETVYSDHFTQDKKPVIEVMKKENRITFINCYVDWVSFCEQFLGLEFKWYQKLYLTTYYKLRYFFKTGHWVRREKRVS